MTFRLISCDGGGVRGLITAGMIRELNNDTGGKLLASVDGFAGTSTGGLISIALAYGVSIDTVYNIYANPKAILTPDSILGAQDQGDDTQDSATLGSGPGYLYSQYTSKGLYNALHPHVGDTTFHQINGHKMVAVNTVRLDDTAVTPNRWFPVTLNNRNIDGYQDMKLIDAALCTSAAPTYFPPHQAPGYGYFADGGTFANNPVMNGYEVARRTGAVTSLSDIEVISFGTGLTAQKIPTASVGNPLDWGVRYWMWPDTSNDVPGMALLNMALDNSAANITMVAQGLLGSAMVRLNPTLTTNVPLDGSSGADITAMTNAVKAAKHLPEWTAAKAMIAGW